MDAVEISLSAGGLALALIGGIVGYSRLMADVGRTRSTIEDMVESVTELEKLPNRVLLLENEQKHTTDSLDEIKESVSRLAQDVRASNHRTNGHLQDQANQMGKMSAQMELLVKAFSDGPNRK